MHVNANTLQRTPRFARIKSCTKTVPPVFSFSDFAIGSLGPVGRDAFSKVDTVQSSDRECTYKSICVLIGYAFLKPLRTSLQLIPALRPHLHSFSPLLISAPILSHSLQYGPLALYIVAALPLCTPSGVSGCIGTNPSSEIYDPHGARCTETETSSLGMFSQCMCLFWYRVRQRSPPEMDANCLQCSQTDKL